VIDSGRNEFYIDYYYGIEEIWDVDLPIQLDDGDDVGFGLIDNPSGFETVTFTWVSQITKVTLTFYQGMTNTDSKSQNIAEQLIGAPVGGEILPVNKLQLIAPNLLILALAVAGTVRILSRKGFHRHLLFFLGIRDHFEE